MKLSTLTIKRLVLGIGLILGISPLIFTGLVHASSSATATVSTPSANSSSSTSLSTSQQQQHLANIQTKGAAEINRRLTSLNTVLSKINSMTKLSASDKTTLTNEVNTEISGLTALKAQLAADTTLSAAESDAQSIFTEYRVYALVLPKVWLVKTADDELTTEGQLSSLATKLQARITDEQNAGKDVSALQTDLTDMNTQITNSQSISTTIEIDVINLQPSDYDSDHTILSGDVTQLKTAHSDNVTASTDAKNIISALTSM